MKQDVARGALIGPYTIGAQLSAGGMGAVYLAIERLDNGKQRNVAVKFPRLSVVHDEDVIQGFFNEAETMVKFRSSRIPEIYTWGIHEGLPYVAMEFISGVSLSQFLQKQWESGRKISFDIAAHIIREVALALDYAHNFIYEGRPMHVLHRDVAAKNVMLDSAGDVYLIDFGVVRTTDTRANAPSSASVVKGTLNYLAPEHAGGEPCAASDVFGLHAILWEMLEGGTFRSGRSERQLWADAIQGHVPPLTRTGVPDFLEELLARGLHPDPEQRIRLTDAITVLEDHSKPRTSALKRLFARSFDKIARRSGSTIVDGVDVSSELLRTIAAAKAAHEDPTPAAIEPQPSLTSAQAEMLDKPTLPPRRPSTDPGIVAVELSDDERPPAMIEQPEHVVAATAILQPLDGAQVSAREERGYTVPLLPAIPEEPAPLPPEPQPMLAAEPVPVREPHGRLPTQPEHAAASRPEPAPDTRFQTAPAQRRPWLLGGAVSSVLLAGVTAFFVINSEPRTEQSPEMLAAREPEPAPPRRDEQAPPAAPATAALEIPDGIVHAPPPVAPIEVPAPKPEVEAKVDPPAASEPVDTASEAETSIEPAPPSSKPASPNPRTSVTLRPGFSAAEVRIGSGKVIHLSKTRTLQVRTGSVTLRWRFPPETAWSKKTVRLRPGQAYVILVERTGARVQKARR